MKYVKRPVAIEAVQWKSDNLEEAKTFLGADFGRAQDSYVVVKNKTGNVIAAPGDWLMRGVQGEHYVCPEKVFAESYVPVVE